MMRAMTTCESGKLRRSDFVTVKRNADVHVPVSGRRKPEFTAEEREGLIREVMGPRAGSFKLESSSRLTPSEALDKYRAGATVEHLIHSLKRATGLKPLRAWNGPSIRRSMLLALLSEVAIAMARHGMKGVQKTAIERGRRRTSVEKPCTEPIMWSLSHLTVTRIVEKGVARRRHSAIGAPYPRRFSPISDPRMRNMAKAVSESYGRCQMSNEPA